jgi:hypothetical protein
MTIFQTGKLRLSQHLCLSTSERNYQLRAHYQELLTPPKRSNLGSWFGDWLETTRLMKEAALGMVDEVGTCLVPRGGLMLR